MPLPFTLTTTAVGVVAADLLAVPVFAERLLGPGADAVDAALGGGLTEFMDETDFNGKPGEALAVPTGGRLGAKAVILVGVGAREEMTLDGVRRAAATVAKRASKVTSLATTLLDAVPDPVDRAGAAQALAEGIGLGRYKFLRYKGDPKPSKLARVVVVGRGGAKVRAGLQRGARIAEAVGWARDLVNEPAGAKSPAEIAALTRKVGRSSGLKVKVLAGAQLEAERLGGVIGVGQGSQRPPCMVRIAYEPVGARGTIAFIGKGVVFDSGGLSLKTAAGMETMKTDMSGAAAVIAAMSALRDLGVKARVIGYVPLVENMPSGAAIRPGDVLTHRNG